jgi:hypothetical protein
MTIVTGAAGMTSAIIAIRTVAAVAMVWKTTAPSESAMKW